MAGKYGSDEDGEYCYPNSNVLINKLGITDEDALQAAEVQLSQTRIEQFHPDFDNFSLPALRAIHFHLFQDLYDWAGELRTVDISKGSTRFATVSRIEPEAEKLFRQLQQENLLVALPRAHFVARLAHYYSELNVIHPFRDGNGRAQRLMFELIGINAGFEVRWQAISRAEWIDANIAAFNCQLDLLTTLLDRVLTPI
ncbi:putative adenosine monophosphate-protein transferase Fic [Massilia atriviolacea]|uniref:protein adenylyltransferase n=1 Tax=Massilia atriviolacea TaxID=2495579 RepID=A0A430HGB0_9BURK|nr:putative adenosine monophosphate-protein transferase Fic [Massilia atriviolacea]RSZ56559.1 putative adenosine monophosphate-protein transferase Fic [Massilia atriviolacea]